MIWTHVVKNIRTGQVIGVGDRESCREAATELNKEQQTDDYRVVPYRTRV